MSATYPYLHLEGEVLQVRYSHLLSATYPYLHLEREVLRVRYSHLLSATYPYLHLTWKERCFVFVDPPSNA